MQREAQHGWINTGEINLHYLDWPGTEPTLLCIHGLTGNAHCWNMLADRMHKGERIIAVDVRGRGKSDKPPDGKYGFARHARDVEVLLKELKIGPVTVMGWSMGAYIAILLAAESPELVNSIVLVDGGGIPHAFLSPEGMQMARSTIDRLGMVYPTMKDYFNFWKENASYIPWSEYFELYLKADVEEREDGSVVCLGSAEGVNEDINDLKKWDPEAVIPRVEVPTLILWAPLGLVDPAKPLFTREELEQVNNLSQNGRLITVEDTNHYSIGFSAKGVDQMINAINEFLPPLNK